MRFGDSPESENFEDRTGQSGGGGLSLGGAGGGVIALLAQFVLSRFGFVGLLILLLGYCALTSLGGGGGILGGGSTLMVPSRTIAESAVTSAKMFRSWAIPTASAEALAMRTE